MANTSESSYAKTIFPANHWAIADVVAIVSEGKKEISSSEGQKSVSSSPFMKTRQSHMRKKNILVKKLIKEKNFKEFGELIESEALELHAIMITQYPPLIYFQPNTILLIKLVQKWRQEG